MSDFIITKEGFIQVTKDPQAIKDFTFNYRSLGFLVTGEDITASTWSAPDPAGMVIDSDTNDVDSATARVSGGTVGVKYKITNHITTSLGQQDDRTFIILIKEK